MSYAEFLQRKSRVFGGQYYYRATWAEMAPTGGRATWVIGGDDDDPR